MFPLSRREMLRTGSCGFGLLALAGLSAKPAVGSAPTLAPRTPRLPARAKRVIFLCMSGGPSQADTFDYKPQTTNKPHPGSLFKFHRSGQSGMWISELFPEVSKHADKLCLLNGMYADSTNHSQSFLQLHTGERLRSRPSLGSWVVYGLGSESQSLPGFISLRPTKPSTYASVFLPPIYQGTPIGVNGENMSTATIPNITGAHATPDSMRRQLDLVQSMNREHLAVRPDDANLDAVIESLELGFRMQATAPSLLDTTNETAATLARYGVGPTRSSGTCASNDFGRQCLLARRFVEAGVRFVELNHGSWDQHQNHRADLRANCQVVDRPIAALLGDLQERGLLQDTLVIWGGEFGRPTLTPGSNEDASGHNARGFTFWLAGGGVKAGFVYGKTDETGNRAVDGKVHFRDLHATILNLLGLEHDKLTFEHGGRTFRLTGNEGGQVVRSIIA